ncbi:hypothetical protein ACJX0J_031739, partial [Zea mays]
LNPQVIKKWATMPTVALIGMDALHRDVFIFSIRREYLDYMLIVYQILLQNISCLDHHFTFLKE